MTRPNPLTGRTITLCVTGSIAAYKSVLVLRLLKQLGAELEVVLTESAEQFVGVHTFSGLTGKPVLTDMFAAGVSGELHVALAQRSDALLIAPASADALARLASGRASDLLSALYLCARCPVFAAPAMHPNMWDHPATRRNVATVVADGLQLIGPVRGEVASGDVGVGRMSEPAEIVDALMAGLVSRGDLAGRHLVVTAGPTIEDLDPVRFISNRSSGKMGFAVAERAARRGARVTLIAGPTHLATPPRVERVDVRSARDMEGALANALGPRLDSADALIMAAAVGDYRAACLTSQKLRRESALTVELVGNPDLLAAIGARRTGKRPVLVGFAVETGDERALLDSARRKLAHKRVDLVVANLGQEAFGLDDDRATLVSAEAEQALPKLPKPELADKILDSVRARLDSTLGS